MAVAAGGSGAATPRHRQKLDTPPPSAAHAAALHLGPSWYPDNAEDLRQQLDRYLALAATSCHVDVDPDGVRALVVPHAGLDYSGFCAATAYQTILYQQPSARSGSKNTKIDHVLLLATDHSGATIGITLPTETAFHTPLGRIPVNIAAIETLKIARVSDKELGAEHSLEMQLRWLQHTIHKFTLTPMLVGRLLQKHVSTLVLALTKCITASTLVVVTSDFIHHGPAFHYQVFDKHIVANLRAIDSAIISTLLTPNRAAFGLVLAQSSATVCGQNALALLLSLLSTQCLGPAVEGRLCSYYTSAHIKHARIGDVRDLLCDIPDADAQESVSYAGMVFGTQHVAYIMLEKQLTGFEKHALIALARQSIGNELAGADRTPPHLLWPIASPAVSALHGAFVTLTDQHNKLRGCIGRLTSNKPLFVTIQDMAIAAAFSDSRFTPLTRAELASVSIEITILSMPTPVSSLRSIVLGRHGIVLNKLNGDGSLLTCAVFLPQVPLAMQWSLATTLAELSKKAGLPPHGWQDDDCCLQIFEGYQILEDYPPLGPHR